MPYLPQCNLFDKNFNFIIDKMIGRFHLVWFAPIMSSIWIWNFYQIVEYIAEDTTRIIKMYMYDIYTLHIVFIFLLISHLKKKRLVFRFNLTQMIRVVSNNRTRKVISSNFKKGFRSAENLIALLNLLLRDFFLSISATRVQGETLHQKVMQFLLLVMVVKSHLNM